MKKILEYLAARTPAGITARLWVAVLVTVAALLTNALYIAPQYDHLPAVVPLFFDIDGNVAEWGNRSEISHYAGIRTAFFVIMLLIAWAIYKAKGCTLAARRVGLLVVDIANLVITTGVSMTLVYIEIANGDTSQQLSEHWENAVMLFWLLLLVVEYITDKPHLQQQD